MKPDKIAIILDVSSLPLILAEQLTNELYVKFQAMGTSLSLPHQISAGIVLYMKDTA